MKIILVLLQVVFAANYDQPIVDVRGGTSLRVTYPPSLITLLGNDGKINVMLGNFGQIQYGSTINANLVRPKDQNGCKPFDEFFPSKSMIIVDAGECSITTKARHIE